MSLIDDFEADVVKFLKDLKGKTETELRALYAEALVKEAEVKRELTVLRQRAANAAADINTEAEELVIACKGELEKALAWLKALEQRLFGSDNVKDFNTGQTFKDAGK